MSQYDKTHFKDLVAYTARFFWSVSDHLTTLRSKGLNGLKTFTTFDEKNDVFIVSTDRISFF